MARGTALRNQLALAGVAKKGYAESPMKHVIAAMSCLVAAAAPIVGAAAQDSLPSAPPIAAAAGEASLPIDWIRPGGVARASAVVDSVFVLRSVPTGFILAGDWAAHLMARLGIYPIPPDLRIAVLADTAHIVLRTRVGDLPPEARIALGPLVGMFPPQTEIEGDVLLQKGGPEFVRFHLAAARINGVTVPDRILQEAMTAVGRQYPALTRTGRDLLIQIPPYADVQLERGGVRLVGPPADSVP